MPLRVGEAAILCMYIYQAEAFLNVYIDSFRPAVAYNGTVTWLSHRGFDLLCYPGAFSYHASWFGGPNFVGTRATACSSRWEISVDWHPFRGWLGRHGARLSFNGSQTLQLRVLFNSRCRTSYFKYGIVSSITPIRVSKILHATCYSLLISGSISQILSAFRH